MPNLGQTISVYCPLKGTQNEVIRMNTEEKVYRYIVKKKRKTMCNAVLKSMKSAHSPDEMPVFDTSIHDEVVFKTTSKDIYEHLIGIGFVTDLDEFKDSIAAKEQDKEDRLLNGNKFVSEDGAFLYNEFATWLYEESNHYFIRIRQTNCMYYYEDGIYIPYGETYLEEIIQREIGPHATVSTNHVREITNYIKRSCTQNIDVMAAHNNTIVCKNGVVNLMTKELTPSTPETFAFRRVPYNYVPNAKCPEIGGLLSKLIQDEEQANKVYTMVGYILIDSYIHNKIFFLFGPPGTGKTSVTNIITKMLGINSVSDVRLHDLIQRPFMRVALIDSMVNFCGDASNTPIKDASILKVLSGDGRMGVDMKNIAIPLKLQNCSKIVIDTNSMPVFDRRDKALHRRFVKIPFNVVVAEEDKSADFMAALSTKSEMEGLLARAVDEAHMILTTKNPFKTLSIDEEQLDYDSQTWNIVNDFIARHVQVIPEMVDPDIFTTQGDLWVQFIAFCEKKDTPPGMIAREFNKMLREKCKLGSTVPKTRNGVGKRCYMTVKLVHVDTELRGFKKDNE